MGHIIGLACTLLLHVVLILVAPFIPLGDITGRAGKLPSLADKKAKSSISNWRRCRPSHEAGSVQVRRDQSGRPRERAGQDQQFQQPEPAVSPEEAAKELDPGEPPERPRPDRSEERFRNRHR